MPPTLQFQAINIVLRGAINPVMFHPLWFSVNDLISQKEADAANIQIVHNQATNFSTEWLEINVVPDRFQASTTQEPYFESLRDLVVGVINLLHYVPFRVMGINRDFHFGPFSKETWHGIGHKLTPKEYWDDILTRPGMLSLVMQGQRDDEFDGYIRVKTEPSNEVTNGVFVNVNDHYVLSSNEDIASAIDNTIQILSTRWSNSLQYGNTIADRIAELGE